MRYFENVMMKEEEGKPVGDRENENKPTKSFITMREGFYQDEEKKNALKKKNNPICSRENFI